MVLYRREKLYMKNEIIIFKNQGVKLEVNMNEETVWLTKQQMAKLFDKAKSTINEHIKIYINLRNYLKKKQ